MAGRKPIEISRDDLQSAINLTESDANPPATHTVLWERVTAALGISVNPQTVKAKALAYGCVIKTPKGVRGGAGGDFGRSKGIKPTTVRRKRGLDVDSFVAKVPEQHLTDKLYSIMEKAEMGKIRSIVKLHCLSCSSYSPSEVAKCQVKSCALYSIRPYQPKVTA